MFFKCLSEMLLMWPTYFLSQSGGPNKYTPLARYLLALFIFSLLLGYFLGIVGCKATFRLLCLISLVLNISFPLYVKVNHFCLLLLSFSYSTFILVCFL